MTENELHGLRTTFDSVASQYDMARPDYPAPMYDDIRALSGVPDGGDILEIGCGTGQATLPLAARGYHICAVELGENLAAIARRKLAAFPAVEIRVGPFESMPLDEQSFDLAISATAFHWIEAASYPKLARLLRVPADRSPSSGTSTSRARWMEVSSSGYSPYTASTRQNSMAKGRPSRHRRVARRDRDSGRDWPVWRLHRPPISLDKAL